MAEIRLTKGTDCKQMTRNQADLASSGHSSYGFSPK